MVLCALLYSAPLFAAGVPYDYPFVDPLQATVIGTPKAYQPDLPKDIPKKIFKVDVMPDRDIPDVFWYEKEMKFSLVYQDHKAPLIFIIAGTGGDFDTGKIKVMQRAFYQAGFHVIALSSPTYMNFIITASQGMVPGDLREDARDLYHAMSLAWQTVQKKIEVSKFYLTGYSLGGIESAFVSLLDEKRQQFNFQKVLMINPPVSLYNSVSILDHLLEDNIPGGPEHFNTWFKGVMNNLADVNKKLDLFKLSGDVLYTIYKKYPPTDKFLSALIGTSFRISSSNMIFTMDVMNGGGYIVPRGLKLTPYTSLTDYAIVAQNTQFVDYFHEYFYPHFRALDNGLTEQELKHRESLKSIESYLRNNKKIGLIHNEDDIIMAPGEVDWLKGVLGSRATIFPNGGHCGNMSHYVNVAKMISFFKKGSGAP